MTAETIFSEWLAKQDYWMKRLFCQICDKNVLSMEDYQEIIDDYVKGSYKTTEITIPNEFSQKIVLSRLYDVKGVNRLISGQELVFGNNLTVIYGENGTGKTGYSRVIQHLGKYIGDIKPIKANIFDDSISPEAKIAYLESDDSVEKIVHWTPSYSSTLNIKLFNSSCVNFSLNNERKIDFKPRIFYLCERLTTELGVLKEKVNERLQTFYDSALCTLEAATEAQKIVNEALNDPSKKKLLVLDKYVESLNLEQLQEDQAKTVKELEELNFSSLNKELSILKNKVSVLQRVVNLILDSIAHKNNWYEEYAKNTCRIEELKKQSSINDLLSQINIPIEYKSLFVKFIEATEKLVKNTNPDLENISQLIKCPFCNHDFDKTNDELNNLLNTYQQLLVVAKSQSTESLEKRNKEIDAAFAKIANSLDIFEENTVFVEDHILLEKLKSLTAFIRQYGNANSKNLVDDLIDSLKAVIDKVNEAIKENEAKNACLVELQTTKRSCLNEINARLYLLKNWEHERAYILSYINLSALKGINSHSIAICQKDIQEKIYKDSFIEILTETLTRLKAPPEVKFNTSIRSSQMAIKQGYDKISKDNQLNEILSEGEQTVVALAQFIAESVFNPNDNVLFFDDPVNSLDLGRMQVIARELVALTKTKQVIIFTHNLVFLGFIKDEISKIKEPVGLKHYKFYQTARTEVEDKSYVGLLTETVNPNTENYEYYRSEIERAIKNSSKQPLLLDQIKTLYGYLRCAIELLICEKMFRGTIERYRPDISVIRFGRIKTDKIIEDQEKIIELYEQVCRFIDGHSSSPFVKIDPDITSLKEDFEKLKYFEKNYK